MARRTICEPIFSSPSSGEAVDHLRRAQERDAAAGDDAFLDRRAGRVQGVLDAGLLLLHLDLGRGADIDDGDAAGQLGEALLELLAVVVGGGLVDLAADLLHAALDVGALAAALDDRRVLLVDDDALCAAEVADRDVLKLDAEVLGEALPPVRIAMSSSMALRRSPKPGALTAHDIERAADLVDHKGGQGLALDLLGDDEERLAALGDGLQQREQVVERADLLLVDEDVGVLEDGLHGLGVGHEIRREVALVELHALDDFEGRLDRLGLLDRDRAVLADLVHGVGDDVADRLVPVGGDGGDLADLLAVGDLLRDLGQLGDGGLDGLVDAALQVDRVRSGGDVLQALAVDALGEQRGGRGAVAGGVGGLGGDLLHHLGAHVLVGVGQLDFLGDGHAVLGDGRRAEFLVDDDVAALGAEGHLDGAREQLDAAQDFLTSGLRRIGVVWQALLILVS